MNELENLKNQIINRQILMDDLCKRAAMLQALYEYEKGLLEIRRMETYFECMQLKQKMEIIQNYRRQGHGISSTLMDSMLSAQSNDHSYVLRELKEKTRRAKEQLDMLQPDSARYQVCKDLYRSILQKGSGDSACLDQARTAYLKNDRRTLEELQDLPVQPAEETSEQELNLELSVLDESIADLMDSIWLQQEETLLSEQKEWLQPMEDECAYYENIKGQMESLIEKTGHS